MTQPAARNTPGTNCIDDANGGMSWKLSRTLLTHQR